MCVLLDMYEERGVEKGISQGIEEINTLYHCLLADNRMEDIQKAIMDTDYQKELLREYGIGADIRKNFYCSSYTSSAHPSVTAEVYHLIRLS